MLKWLLVGVAIIGVVALLRVLSTRTLTSSGESRAPVALDVSTFVAGSRVLVSPEYHWAQGASGIIADPPEPVRTLAGNWQGVTRVVDGVRGPLTFYWVQFDQPQRDVDGGGPYFGAEIDAAYLQSTGGVTDKIPPLPDGTVEAAWYENKRLGKKVEFRAFLK